MGRLNELIQELCPNGVEYKRIDELCDVARGIVISKQFIEDNKGAYPVYSSQTENDGELGKINTYKYDGEYLTNAGSVFYRNGKFNVTNVCGLLKNKFNRLNTKFLYYVLSIEAPKYVNRGMGNAKLMSNVMSGISVPVPPRPIQDEIVRILDHITELTARKKQYEYYRDELLNFNDKIEFVSFSELFNVKNGLNKGKSFFGHGSPIINFTDVYKHRYLTSDMINGKVEVTDDEINRFSAKKGDVFFTRTSETKEDIGMSSTLVEDIPNCAFSGFVLRARPKTDKLLPKFCSYYFSSSKIRNDIIRYASFTTRATTTGDKLSKLKMPILPLDVQQRLVNVLENFESICSDLNIGLLTEIEARQKQYEYYRDLLLTFAKTGDTIVQTADKQ